MSLAGLDALRRRFAERAREEEHEQIATWNREGRSIPTPIERVIHNMTGAAGTLGFTAIYEAAARIDDRFALGETPGEDEVEALLAAIDALPRSG